MVCIFVPRFLKIRKSGIISPTIKNGTK